MQMLDNHRLELGEGPGYDPARDLAWWFDIERNRLFTRKIGGGETEVHELPFSASAMAVTTDGRQLMLAENGLYLRDPRTGALSLHLAIDADDPVTRSNDARVHPSGAFWISTMGWRCEPGVGSFYHYFRGRLERLWAGITIPNAICFSPDGTIAYYCDTPSRTIMRVATDPRNGRPLAAPETFLGPLAGSPDGAVTDADGNIWVTFYGLGKVNGYTPNGREIGSLSVPAANVTCPAFVGPEARHMLVTTALHGIPEADRIALPEAGATFITELDFRGRFDPPVAL